LIIDSGTDVFRMDAKVAAVLIERGAALRVPIHLLKRPVCFAFQGPIPLKVTDMVLVRLGIMSFFIRFFARSFLSRAFVVTSEIDHSLDPSTM
jgi:hypothetical protein